MLMMRKLNWKLLAQLLKLNNFTVRHQDRFRKGSVFSFFDEKYRTRVSKKETTILQKKVLTNYL